MACAILSRARFENNLLALLKRYPVDHPQWSEFSYAYDSAAPHKLIMAEAIEQVELMVDVAKSWGFDEIKEGVDDNIPFDEAEDDDGETDPHRCDQERDYVENVTESVHTMVGSVEAAQSELPSEPAELEEWDAASRKAVAALDAALSRVMRIVTMVSEPWSD